MNILTISNYFPEHIGGIEIVAMNLVQKWRKRHNVCWMACEVPDSPHLCMRGDKPYQGSNFSEQYLGFPYPIPSISAIKQIFVQVRQCEVVHIHDCLYFANVVSFFASRLYKKPLVITQHIGPVPYKQKYKNILQGIAYRTIGKMVLEKAEGVIFINQRVKNWFDDRILYKRPPKLIPNGVDPDIFFPASIDERSAIRKKLGIKEGKFIALFIGRFTEKKGLKLIRQIAQSQKNIFWIIIGAGEIEPRKWDLPNVTVLDPQPQEALRNYYIAADILILPSSGEGFPLVIQEALSCGLPAVVSEEICHYLADAPLIALNVTSAASCRKTLDNLLANFDHFDMIRKNSAIYAKRWNWDQVAITYERIFSQVQGDY